MEKSESDNEYQKEIKGVATDDNVDSVFMGNLHNFYSHPGLFVIPCFTKFTVVGIFLLLNVKEPEM